MSLYELLHNTLLIIVRFYTHDFLLSNFDLRRMLINLVIIYDVILSIVQLKHLDFYELFVVVIDIYLLRENFLNFKTIVNINFF